MRHFLPATIGLVIALFSYGPLALAHDGEKHEGSTAPAPTAPANIGIQITVENGWLSAGPDVVRVKQGEQVVLTITSNEADELHLHGYDITLPLVANTPATLSFTAKHAGRFGYELHHAHREIGAIEVHP